MKKRLILLTLLTVILGVGCSDNNDDNNQGVDAYINFISSDLTFPSEGGTQSFQFETNVGWTLQSDKDWCVVSPKSGEAGTHTLTVTVDGGTSETTETANVTITAGKLPKSFKVTREGVQGAFLRIDPSQTEITAKAEGDEITIKVITNTEYEVIVEEGQRDWILHSRVTEGVEKLEITKNDIDTERKGTVTFKSADDSVQPIVVTISQAKLDVERAILMKFYESAGGAGWTKKTNWGSDKPLDQWYGISLNEEGRVNQIQLAQNNLTGSIPEDIADLTDLEVLFLVGNSGLWESPMPQRLSELKKLSYLDLRSCGIEGELPDNFGDLLNNAPNTMLLLHGNLITNVPNSVTSHARWNELALQILPQNYYADRDVPDYYIPNVDFILYDDTTIKIHDVCKENKLTVYVYWAGWCGYTKQFFEGGAEYQVYKDGKLGEKKKAKGMFSLYETYKDKGLGFVGLLAGKDEITAANNYMNSKPIMKEWVHAYDYGKFEGRSIYLPGTGFPTPFVMDSNGKIVFNNVNRNQIEDFVAEYMTNGAESAQRKFGNSSQSFAPSYFMTNIGSSTNINIPFAL